MQQKTPRPLPTPEEMARIRLLADALPPDTICYQGLLSDAGIDDTPITAKSWTADEIEAELELAQQG
jgi:hypothetical protein